MCTLFEKKHSRSYKRSQTPEVPSLMGDPDKTHDSDRVIDQLTTLTTDELKRLREFKDSAWRLAGLGMGISDRTLDDVCLVHRTDFREILDGFARDFPDERIMVLDEGAGHSTFASELERHNKRVRVIRTDLFYDPDMGMNLCPEELVSSFGKDSFHLVVSTFGGMTYTRINRDKALVNIIQLLKPGGLASIASRRSGEFTGGEPVFINKDSLESCFDNIDVSERALPDENFGGELRILQIKRRR